jgi:hypothetical protein
VAGSYDMETIEMRRSHLMYGTDNALLGQKPQLEPKD